MRCKQCEEEKRDESFTYYIGNGGKVESNNSDTCVFCAYENKLNKYKQEQKIPEKEKRCPICKTVVPPGRWVYCCQECSCVGHAKQKEKYWVKSIRAPKISWRTGYDI